MFPDNSILLPIFDQYFLKLVEGGVLDGIVKYYKPQQPTCKKDEMTTISFKFVIIMFSILGFGVFLSIIILFVEKIAIRFYSPGNFWSVLFEIDTIMNIMTHNNQHVNMWNVNY